MRFDRESLSNELLKSYIEDEDQAMMDEYGRSRSKFKIVVPLFALLIVGFMTYVWYIDTFSVGRSSHGDVPLIQANIMPVRFKPKDPGGMVIANRDKMVYDNLSKATKLELPKVTRILPRTEEPINREEIIDLSAASRKLNDGDVTVISSNRTRAEENKHEVTQVLSDIAKHMPTQDDASQPQRLAQPLPEVVLGNKTVRPVLELLTEEMTVSTPANKTPIILEKKQANTEASTVQKPEEIIVVASIENNGPLSTKPTEVESIEVKEAKLEKKEVKAELKSDELVVQKPNEKKLTMANIKTEPVPIPIRKEREALLQPSTGNKGKYAIQLGSYRNESDVEESWARISKRHNTLLAGVDHFSEKANLAKRGVFYRLKAGPFKDSSQARSLCKKLSEHKQGCFFVKQR